MDIARWLSSFGLAKYAENFARNEITPEVLQHLSDADLEVLGLPMGPRKLVLAEIVKLRESEKQRPHPSVGPTPHPQAERRQLTVMFVDLAESTVLSGQLDPEEMGEIIRAYQNAVAKEIAQVDGHVAKFMGDGVLAYFGWPRAHENEAERAVRAGLAITATVGNLATPAKGPLAARVGIATGLVMVGDLVGEGAAQEAAVVGETPNLAARLQSLAPVGSVVVAEPTRRLLGELFELLDLGTHDLKGFATPIRAWQVIGESRTEGRFEALHGPKPSSLVGRDRELDVAPRTLAAGQEWLRPGSAVGGRAGHRQVTYRNRLERAPARRGVRVPALSRLALSHQQRAVSGAGPTASSRRLRARGRAGGEAGQAAGTDRLGCG